MNGVKIVKTYSETTAEDAIQGEAGESGFIVNGMDWPTYIDHKYVTKAEQAEARKQAEEVIEVEEGEPIAITVARTLIDAGCCEEHGTAYYGEGAMDMYGTSRQVGVHLDDATPKELVDAIADAFQRMR